MGTAAAVPESITMYSSTVIADQTDAVDEHPSVQLLIAARTTEPSVITAGIHEPSWEYTEPPVVLEPEVSNEPAISELGFPATDWMEAEVQQENLPHPLVFTHLKHTGGAPFRDEYLTDFDVERYLALSRPAKEEDIPPPVPRRQVRINVPDSPESIADSVTQPDAEQTGPNEPENDNPTRSDSAPVTTVIASLKDTIAVALKGTDWVFIGVEPLDSGLIFTGRKIDATDSTFFFDPLHEGDFYLSFLQQDNEAGTAVSDRRHISVRADTTSADSSVIGDVAEPEPTRPMPSEVSVAELLRAGDFDGILPRLQELLAEANATYGPMLLSLFEGFLENDNMAAAAACLERYLEIFPQVAGIDRFFNPLVKFSSCKTIEYY